MINLSSEIIWIVLVLVRVDSGLVLSCAYFLQSPLQQTRALLSLHRKETTQASLLLNSQLTNRRGVRVVSRGVQALLDLTLIGAYLERVLCDESHSQGITA